MTATLSNTFAEVQYQELFMRAPLGICLSRDRIILLANTSLENMFGVAAGALSQTSFDRLYPTSLDYLRIGLQVEQGLTGDSDYKDERVMRRSDGELFWCHVVGRILPLADSQAVTLWTFEDISATRPVLPLLSKRDQEVAALLAAGKTSKEIARHLNLSPRTVEDYRARLMKKFSATTSAGLIHKLMSISCL